MILLAIAYSVYFFLCYGLDTKPNAEGLFLPFIACLLLALYQAVIEDRVVNILVEEKETGDE
tara:strand:- start:585 stop:770 length:186 start_codon:yes stop_codon:yes gene_type:complete